MQSIHMKSTDKKESMGTILKSIYATGVFRNIMIVLNDGEVSKDVDLDIYLPTPILMMSIRYLVHTNDWL